MNLCWILISANRRGWPYAWFGDCEEDWEGLKKQGFNELKVWALKENKFRRFYEKQNGALSGEKTIKLGEQELCEVLYRCRF